MIRNKNLLINNMPFLNSRLLLNSRPSFNSRPLMNKWLLLNNRLLLNKNPSLKNSPLFKLILDFVQDLNNHLFIKKKLAIPMVVVITKMSQLII